MFPDLSYVFNYFLGTTPDGILSVFKTYGIFLSVALMVGVTVFKSEVERKTKNINIFNIKESDVFFNNVLLVSAISGLIGSKIFALFEVWPQLMTDPIDTILYRSGISFYGGLIIGFIATLFYFYKNGMPLLLSLDAVSPALALGYGIGRLGCHFSGDGDWGIPSPPNVEWWKIPRFLWSFNFPHNVIQSGVVIEGCRYKYNKVLESGVYPTSLYESLFFIFAFLFFWKFRHSIKLAPGVTFCLYLILNGTERFFIEFIRINKKYNIFGHFLSQSQLIAICLCCLGIFLTMGVYFFNKTKN